MKTRTGFVSNSSSSSFVVIGVKLDKDVLEALKKSVPPEPDEEDWEWENRVSEQLSLRTMWVSDDEKIVGQVLSDISSDSGDSQEREDYDLSVLMMMFNDVEKVVGSVPKLMFGTRPS